MTRANSDWTVAVIGAGMAGLAAASSLESARWRVSVFEKSRGLGGRASTRRADGRTFDLGAQYATARNPEFGRWLEAARVAGLAAPWTGPIVDLEGGRVTDRAETVERWVGTPRMSMLARAFPLKSAVRVSLRVESVRRNEGRWCLVDSTGGEHGPFDAVVVATPAPQAVPLLSEAPDLAARAATAEMLPCVAWFAAFDGGLGLDFDGAFVHGSPLSWVARDSSKPGRAAGRGECWVVHAGPEWSAAHLEDGDGDLHSLLRGALEAALGRQVGDPIHSAVHRWRYARSAAPGGEGYLWDPDRRLGVCGDWLHGDRLEGAWQSGRALSAVVAQASLPG